MVFRKSKWKREIRIWDSIDFQASRPETQK